MSLQKFPNRVFNNIRHSTKSLVLAESFFDLLDEALAYTNCAPAVLTHVNIDTHILFKGIDNIDMEVPYIPRELNKTMDDDWQTIRIHKGVVQAIKKFLQTQRAKEAGFTNMSQFVDEAVRAAMEKWEIKSEIKRFEHFNFHENIIRVLDNQIGVLGDIVELRKRGQDLLCSHCEAKNCIHIKYVWTDEQLSSKLRQAGLRSPF